MQQEPQMNGSGENEAAPPSSTEPRGEPALVDQIARLEQQVADLRQAVGAQADRIGGVEAWANQMSHYILRAAPHPGDAARTFTGSPAAPVRAVPAGMPGPSAVGRDHSASGFDLSGPATTHTTRRAEADMESVIGGSWLNRVGAVALILGLAFFVKLAADYGWFTQWMRVGAGVLIGAGLLAAGERTRRRGMTSYSYGLSGTGFAALYLSVYAAYGPYHLIGFVLAFTLLALVSAGAVVRAVTIEAEAVAALGTFCGFLTPAVLGGGAGPGAGSVAPLFTYLWLLNAGVLAAACVRDWKRLKLGSLALTTLFVAVWLSEHFTPALLFPTTVAVTLLFLLVVGIGGIYPLVRHKVVDDADVSLLLLNPLFYALFLGIYYYDRSPRGLGLAAIGLALMYALLTMLALKRGGWTAALAVSLLAVSTGFVTLAVPLLLGGDGTIAGWFIEALVLLWGGLAVRSSPLRAASFVLYALAGIGLAVEVVVTLTQGAALGSQTPFFFAIELPAAVGTTVALAGAWLLSQNREMLSAEEREAPAVLIGCTCIAGFLWLTAEVVHRAAGSPDAVISTWLSVAWSFYSAGLLAIGVGYRRRLVRLAGLLMLAIVVAKVFAFDMWLLDLVYRVVSLFVLAAVLWGGSYLYSRYRDRVQDLVLGRDG